MAYTGTTDDIVASLTQQGREAIAKSTLPAEGYGFILSGFKAGRGGYNESNPVKVVSVNDESTELIDPVFPEEGNKDFESIENVIAPYVIAPICRIDKNEEGGNFGFGEIGIYATVLESSNSSEIGEEFLFALAHFPLLAKTESQTLVWRVIIAL